MSIEQQRAAFDNRPFHEITLRAKDLEELGLSVVFINSGRNDSNELARKNALLIKSAIELDRQGRGEPVGWHTEDHLTDKSATTYDPVVAERWRVKGWPVSPLFKDPQPTEPVQSGYDTPYNLGWTAGWDAHKRAEPVVKDDEYAKA